MADTRQKDANKKYGNEEYFEFHVALHSFVAIQYIVVYAEYKRGGDYMPGNQISGNYRYIEIIVPPNTFRYPARNQKIKQEKPCDSKS